MKRFWIGLMVWGMVGSLCWGAKTVSIENSFIKVIVNNQSSDKGVFALETTAGNPANKDDDRQPLIYGRPFPWSSFASVKVDGEVFMLGGENNRILKRRRQQWPYVAPRSVNVKGDTLTTVYQNKTFKVLQMLSFVRNPATQVKDACLIEYKLINLTSKKQKMGMRMMLDTKLGANDGAPFRMGAESITAEKVFKKQDLLDYWMVFDDLASPNVVAQGILNWPEMHVVAPDTMVLANWGLLADNLWEFEAQEGRSFLREGEDEQDTALSMFWDPVDVVAKGSRTIRTVYGLGGVTLQPGQLSLGLTAPKEMVPHIRQNYLLMAYVANTGGFASKNTRVHIRLPKNVTTQDPLTYHLGDLAAGAMVQFPINVVVSSTDREYDVFKMNIDSDTLPSNEVERKIRFLPKPELRVNMKVEPLPSNRVAVNLMLENRFDAPLDKLSAVLDTVPAMKLPTYEPAQKSIGTLGSKSKYEMKWVFPWDLSKSSLTIKVAVKRSQKVLNRRVKTLKKVSQKVNQWKVNTTERFIGDVGTISMTVDVKRAVVQEEDRLVVEFDAEVLDLLRVSQHPDWLAQHALFFKSSEGRGVVTQVTYQSDPVQPVLKYHFKVLKNEPTAITFKMNDHVVSSVDVLKEDN